MEVLSVSPLRVASLLWQARPGAWVLTVVCKATYRLEPGESKLAEAQEHPNDDDNHWDDDPRKSVRFASDLAPYKTRADVIVIGSAHAPPGTPIRELLARLIVGEVDKSVAIHADRAWTLDGALREGPRFSKMSLRWERAAGGPETSNPVGAPHDAPNGIGEIPLPNLLPPAFVPSHRGEMIEPIGWGPIAPSWPSRREKLGALAPSFQLRHLAGAPMPREVDAAFFQIAPRDRQPQALAGDTLIVLEHLHPQHPRLVTKLPGLRPRVFVERPGGLASDLAVRADTLTIDTDRGTATLVWRGQWMLSSKDEQGRVLVAMEKPGARVTLADAVRIARGLGVAANAPQDDINDVESLSDDDVRPADDTLFPGLVPAPAAAGQATDTLFLVDAPALETLPFGPEGAHGSSALDTLRRAEQAAAEVRAAVLPMGWAAPSPFGAPPSAAGRVAPLSGVARPAPERDAPLPPRDALMAPTAMLPGGALPASSPAPPPIIAARPVFLHAMEPVSMAAPRPAEVAIAPALLVATDDVKDAAKLGVAGLSAAAAAGAHGALAKETNEDIGPIRPRDAKSEVEPRRPPAPPEAFDLVWHAPELAKKLRMNTEWRRIFFESDLEPPAEGEFEVMAEEDAETAEEADRRRIADAVARGAPLNVAAVREAVRKAVRPSGRFAAPILLLDGELELSFDEVETLRAVTAAAAPFAIDKRIKEAMDAAQEVLRSTWIAGAGAAADTFAERLREAFAAMRKEMPSGRRPIASDYLDTTAGRTLATGRHYLKRPVYGEPHVRAALRFIGGEERMPIYLSEDAARRLPLSAKHRVRVFAEVGPRVDMGEGSRLAGKVLAVGAAVAAE